MMLISDLCAVRTVFCCEYVVFLVLGLRDAFGAAAGVRGGRFISHE